MKNHSILLKGVLLLSPEMDETPTRVTAVRNIRTALSRLSEVRVSSEFSLPKDCDYCLRNLEASSALSQFLHHHLCFFVTTVWERRAPRAFVDLLDRLSQQMSSVNGPKVLMDQVIVLVVQEPDNFFRNDWSTIYREEYLRAAFSFLNIQRTVFLDVSFDQEIENEGDVDQIAQMVRFHYQSAVSN